MESSGKPQLIETAAGVGVEWMAALTVSRNAAAQSSIGALSSGAPKKTAMSAPGATLPATWMSSCTSRSSVDGLDVGCGVGQFAGELLSAPDLLRLRPGMLKYCCISTG